MGIYEKAKALGKFKMAADGGEGNKPESEVLLDQLQRRISLK